MKSRLQFLMGGLVTISTYNLGGIDVALKTLFTLMIIDYITGILKAAKLKELNSKIGAKGIIKKIGYILTIALAVNLDILFLTNNTLRNSAIYLFICNEGLSILENMAILEVPLPGKIKETLEQFKEHDDKIKTKNVDISTNNEA